MSSIPHDDPVERMLDLIESTRHDALPAGAIEAAKVFLQDTAGVALAGALAPKLPELCRVAEDWDGRPASGVPIWNVGQRASAPTAALINGYQCHALEYDCVYEPGVILPTPPIMSALFVKAWQLEQTGRTVSGEALIRAFVLALEVSCTLADAAKSSMFFFRPATTGVFSALTALCCLDPLPREQMRYAFGIGYSQMCGTMQAHEEGSMMLAMQMGFAARNAVQAHAMARAGITAPVELLGGRFGFYTVFEHEHALPEALQRIGDPWKVTRLSHKPFPSGRVTHGVVHALRQLRLARGWQPDRIDSLIDTVRVELPPLGFRLTGRPTITDPPPNYARLCIPFVAAAELLTERMDPTTFRPEVLGDVAIEALARRVETSEVPHPDPNAFYPQRLIIRMHDGEAIEQDIPFAWGHPELPLDERARADKFGLCARLASAPGDGDERREAFERWMNRLEGATHCRPLLDLLEGNAR